jgi:hypothetical protein
MMNGLWAEHADRNRERATVRAKKLCLALNVISDLSIDTENELD